MLDLCSDVLRVALGLPISPAAPALSRSAALGQAFLGGVLGLVVALAAYHSPRNRLAFEIDVDDEDLQRVYDRYLSNPMAVRGAVYSALALFIPFASLMTLVMSIGALRRATSEAWPPRGGRLPALLGIALSALGALAWTLVVAAAIARRGH
jgi:hypothetical protein